MNKGPLQAGLIDRKWSYALTGQTTDAVFPRKMNTPFPNGSVFALRKKILKADVCESTATSVMLMGPP